MVRHVYNWYNHKNLSGQFSDIDECVSSPCIHGTCQDAINNFTCICDMGYTDILCDRSLAPKLDDFLLGRFDPVNEKE